MRSTCVILLLCAVGKVCGQSMDFAPVQVPVVTSRMVSVMDTNTVVVGGFRDLRAMCGTNGDWRITAVLVSTVGRPIRFVDVGVSMAEIAAAGGTDVGKMRVDEYRDVLLRVAKTKACAQLATGIHEKDRLLR